MPNKNLKEKIIEQKYKNKNELVLARNNLQEMIKKIHIEQKKARLKTNKLRQDLRREKHDIRNKDKVEKLKIEKKMVNELLLVAENKKLLIKAENGLKENIYLMKLSHKNAIIQQKKKNFIELQNAKKQARLDKKAQKEKIAKIKNKFLDEKNNLKRELWKEMQDNQKTILNAKRELNKTKINIVKKRAQIAGQRIKTKEKARVEGKARIVQARIEKEELKKREIEVKKKHYERLLILKGKTYSSHEKNITDIKNLKELLEIAKDEVHNSKKIFEKEKLEIGKSHNGKLKSDSVSSMEKKASEETQLNATIKWKNDTTDLNKSILELKRSRIDDLKLQKIKKKGRKLYDKKNSNNTKLTIKKLRLSEGEKVLILEMRKLKADNSLIDVREFAKYVAFLTDTKITNDQIQKQIMVPVVNVLMKKTLHMFNGYFRLKKIGEYHLIKWTKEAPSVKNNVVAPSKKPYTIMFERILKQKLEKGAIIKISSNIAIKLVENKIIVLHDLPFLR